MIKRFFPGLLFVSGCMLLLAGCTGGIQIRGLSVNVVGIKSATPNLLETQAVATLRVVNENVLPVGITGSTHKLYLNGAYVGQAVSNQPLGIPQLSTATQDVTILLDNLSVINELRKLPSRRAVGYEIRSVLYVDAGEDRINVKTDNHGTVDLSAWSLGSPANP